MANVTWWWRENKMARKIQALLSKTSVMPLIASFKEEATLTRGQSVNRPTISDVTVWDYTALTDATKQDWTLTQELLTVDQSKIIRQDYDPVEVKQIEYDIPNDLVKRIAYRLRDQMDRKFLTEVANANLSLDAWNFWGTSWAPVDLSSIAAERVFADAYATLAWNAVESDKPWYAVVDPFTASSISQRAISQWFNLWDRTFANGYTWNFLDFKVFVSNNLPATVDFTIATAIPAATDTTTINGVVFTWQTTIWVVPWAVLAETSVTQSAANLVVAINAWAWAATKYVEVSAANRKKLTNSDVVATSAAWVVTITSAWRMTLSKSFATPAQWVFWDQTVKAMCGQMWAIDAVVQMKPNIQINKQPWNLWSTILGHTLYGVKSFTEGRDRNLRLDIKA